MLNIKSLTLNKMKFIRLDFLIFIKKLHEDIC